MSMSMSVVVGVVVPGTSVTPIIDKVLSEVENQKIDAEGIPIVTLGNGLLQTSGDTVAVKAGLLHFTKPGKFWIETHQKRVSLSSSSHGIP